MTKFLNTLLILIILVAGGRLAMRGLELRAYAEERDQLMEKLDGFRVRDPSKYLVQFVEDDDPMLFSWRIYTPGGWEAWAVTEFGGSKGTYRSSRFGTEGNVGATSVRLEVIDDRVYFDTRYVSGGRRQAIGGAALVAICTEYWSELDVEVLGRGEPVEIEVDQAVDLLEIRIPDALFAKLKKKYGKEFADQFSKQLLCRMCYSKNQN